MMFNRHEKCHIKSPNLADSYNNEISGSMTALENDQLASSSLVETSSAEDQLLRHCCPDTTDPWFQKHGVKGFLDWELLAEDMPADRWFLASSYPTLPQLSPRGEARNLAKVNR